jgi:hypothetical protein
LFNRIFCRALEGFKSKAGPCQTEATRSTQQPTESHRPADSADTRRKEPTGANLSNQGPEENEPGRTMGRQEGRASARGKATEGQAPLTRGQRAARLIDLNIAYGAEVIDLTLDVSDEEEAGMPKRRRRPGGEGQGRRRRRGESSGRGGDEGGGQEEEVAGGGAKGMPKRIKGGAENGEASPDNDVLGAMFKGPGSEKGQLASSQKEQQRVVIDDKGGNTAGKHGDRQGGETLGGKIVAGEVDIRTPPKEQQHAARKREVVRQGGNLGASVATGECPIGQKNSGGGPNEAGNKSEALGREIQSVQSAPPHAGPRNVDDVIRNAEQYLRVLGRLPKERGLLEDAQVKTCGPERPEVGKALQKGVANGGAKMGESLSSKGASPIRQQSGVHMHAKNQTRVDAEGAEFVRFGPKLGAIPMVCGATTSERIGYGGTPSCQLGGKRADLSMEDKEEFGAKASKEGKPSGYVQLEKTDTAKLDHDDWAKLFEGHSQ